MKKRRIAIFTGGIILLLSIIACTMNLGGPAYPQDRIPLSTEAVTQVQHILETSAAQSDANAGKSSITLTEEQATSYLAYQLQKQDQPMITDPQVYLRDGTVQIYGRAVSNYVTATVKIVVTLSVDAEGGLKIELTSADFGPLPVPQGLKDTVTNAIRDAYRNALGSAANHFRLENITVANGLLTITGEVQ